MPLYEYQCPKCGRFELIRKFSDDPVTECPTCGSPVQKLASAPAFHLKGTGWYATDYAKKTGGADGKSESKSESKSSGKSDSKSDSASSDSGKSAAGDTAKGSAKDTKDTSSAAGSKSKKSD